MSEFKKSETVPGDQVSREDQGKGVKKQTPPTKIKGHDVKASRTNQECIVVSRNPAGILSDAQCQSLHYIGCHSFAARKTAEIILDDALRTAINRLG